MVKKAWVLAILAIFGLTACATMQIDTKELPLPNDVNIIPPSPDLPKDIASFSGKWLGTWRGSGAKGILVVEEIHDTWAQVIYSWGDNPWRRSREPAGYNRQACKIISDPKPKIVVSAPLGDIYFEMKDLNTLAGDYSGRSNLSPGTTFITTFTAIITMKRAN